MINYWSLIWTYIIRTFTQFLPHELNIKEFAGAEMFSSVFLVSVWLNLPDDLRDDSRCWGILNFYSKCLNHYFNSTIANWECFLLACVFLAAGDGRHQSFPPRQRTLDEVWRSGDGNDHHQGWKVERRDNYSVFFFVLFWKKQLCKLHTNAQYAPGTQGTFGLRGPLSCF